MIECDVRQIWLCQSSIAQAEEKFGRIDVVINTASKSALPHIPQSLIFIIPQCPHLHHLIPPNHLHISLPSDLSPNLQNRANNSFRRGLRRNLRLELPRTTRSKLLRHSKYNPLCPPWNASTQIRAYHQYHRIDRANRHAEFKFIECCSSCCGGIFRGKSPTPTPYTMSSYS